ncbi:MAG TPA: glycosyltransferase family 2 protein [Mycobacteriales bacterium]|nr:glycosyltransferase family 2 protein [Mycobacteriales bacterium]
MAGPPSTPPGSVGVVVVAYEPGPIIGRTLAAILDEQPAAVVVVDNSPVASPDVARSAAAHPGVIVANRPDNPGFTGGNNLGLTLLPPTEFVLFLNPDAVVGPGFLEAAVRTLRGDPAAAALNPKLVRLDPDSLQRTGEIDCAGVFHSWYGRSYDRGQGEPDDGRHSDGIEAVPALCGAAFFARRTVLEQVAIGGQVFDETFFMYKEDVDLSYRLRAKGWRLLYDPALEVGHVRGAHAVTASPESRRQLRRLSLRNDWRVWRRGTLPMRVRVPMLPYLVAKTAIVWLMPSLAP